MKAMQIRQQQTPSCNRDHLSVHPPPQKKKKDLLSMLLQKIRSAHDDEMAEQKGQWEVFTAALFAAKMLSSHSHSSRGTMETGNSPPQGPFNA